QNQGFNCSSQEISVPDKRKVSATEQYFSIASVQARSAFSLSILPCKTKLIFAFFHKDGILPSSLSASIIALKLSILCFCFSRIDIISIPLQPPSPISSNCIGLAPKFFPPVASLVSILTIFPFSSFASKPDRKSTRLNSSHVKISYAVF